MMANQEQKKSVTRNVTKSYEPTPSERERMTAYFADKKENPLPPRVKVALKGSVAQVEFDHPDQALGSVLFKDGLATRDSDFSHCILTQLINANTHGQKVDQDGLNFMLSLVQGVKPQDPVETMIATQMAAVHMATMTFAQRLSNVQNIAQQDSAERAFNKLARTFTTQIEALKRYRTGGEQKVTVKHVTVNDGGQAIVGNVTTGGGGAAKKGGTTS
ncbi:MAG: hypothetical protein O3C57_07230 [Verrucomicrobia bacterium]|nr:hypothetical protein [Verrucomicrobiota bacterium]